MNLPERRVSLPPAPARWASGLTAANVRVGDPEREAVVGQLSEHYALGRLQHDELELRTRAALAATTRGELVRVVADLPALPRQAGPRVPPIAAIVVAIVVAATVGSLAVILGVIALFAIPAGAGWGWLVSFLLAGGIAAGSGWYARNGLRARRAERSGRW